MSEYWKSTPKYWCKFCKVFVKDIKFEKAQHEATPRHQGNIQRSIRTLHKENDQAEREKQRAKQEVARLNGVVSGLAATPKPVQQPSSSKSAPPRQATAEERKAQIKQLAALGVEVPEEFKRDTAMPGKWQTVSVTPIAGSSKDPGVMNPDAVAVGVRRKKAPDEEEEEIRPKKKTWGSTLKSYPGAKDEDDLEALLSAPIATKVELEVKVEPVAVSFKQEGSDSSTFIKKEEPDGSEPILDAAPASSTVETDQPIKAEVEAPVKKEAETPGAGIVFKKRKPKPVRQT
ncbi:hypothetical protein EJ06DRAFT_537454 [Trichodelitschia bisporula]|uniref:U1-type domain-containing protein n=1 Tax=Trichodelitschia bisporula TaxID=703511 RepID=A0A6G1HZU8_9PEZI|nr:hypothetical protein EJ06DRAFT_537454 [Trichodelitschia bisporula]